MIKKALVTTKPGFESELKKELEECNLKVKYTPFRGLLYIEGNIDNIKSKYICRLIPVEIICKLEDMEENIIKLINNKKVNGKFVVRCWRRGNHNFTSEDIEKKIGKLIVEKYNFKVDLKNYDFRVNIEILQDIAYISIFTKDFNEIKFIDNIKALNDLKKYSIRPLNRAERKIIELIEKYPYIFNNLETVLDIGSAPGGWIKHLSRLAKKVYAIDKGELKISSENIIHIKDRAENVNIDDKLDLITNDTNLYPEESILLTLKFFDNLKDGKYIIHTLKARSQKTKKEDLNKVINIIKDKNIKILDIVKLPANTKNELTIILKKD